jgi:hypothetical protein
VVGNSNFRRRAHVAPVVVIPAGALRSGFHEPHAPWGYPAPRRIEPQVPGYSSEKYYRMESSGAEITVTDTDAEVFRFSGYPDKIHLHSRTFAALVTLTDRFSSEVSEIIVNPNNPADVFLPRNVVIARNLTAGSAALLFVEGYYLGPSFGGDAR